MCVNAITLKIHLPELHTKPPGAVTLTGSFSQKQKTKRWFLLSSGINLKQHNRECLPPPKHLRKLTLKTAMHLRCGMEWLSFQFPASEYSLKTKANMWLTRVLLRALFTSDVVVVTAAASSWGFFLWNIWWKNDLLFHKVPTPSFSHKDFLSKRPLFSFQLQLQLHAWSSTCAKASAAGTMFKNRTQRLSLCSFFFIRAGLLQNEVRVDGWLDQQ